MHRIHQRLHLQHHRHTGKLLHHRHTSYRSLAVIFVLAGAAMVAVSALGRAAADSFGVVAMVRAPIPTTPAIITLPDPGSTVGSPATLVAGSCPMIAPQVVVDLYVDGQEAGSAVCDSANDFSIPVNFTSGSHTLVARTYTITGDRGPDSSPVTVSYAPAAGTTAPSRPATADPLVITGEQPFAYLGAGNTADWTGTITGGAPPYHVSLDPGQGPNVTYAVAAGPQRFSHHYATLASYDMQLTVTDSAGTSRSLQYAVAAYSTAAPWASGTTSSSTPPVSMSKLAGLYGLYLSAISVCGIIWLEAKHAYKHELKAA